MVYQGYRECQAQWVRMVHRENKDLVVMMAYLDLLEILGNKGNRVTLVQRVKQAA